MAGCIATICARGGSKGLPGKNLLALAGRPLVAHSIEHALACGRFDGVYVSTDDEAIAQAARAAGAIVPYLRPAELATDAAPKLPVIEHLVRHLEAAGHVVERVVDLQPTSPLRTAADIRVAMEVDVRAGLVASVALPDANPYFTLVEQQPDGSVRLCKGTGAARRQDVPEVFKLNGSIYVWTRDALAHASANGLWSVDVKPYLMPRWKSVDIDDAEDFAMAQWLFELHRGELA